MRRGTTPTLIFTTPYRADQIEGGYVTFAQRGVAFLEKDVGDEDVEVGDYVIKLYLTQEDTLKMSAADELKCQIRLKMTGNKAVASQIMETRVGDILKGGEI